MGFIVVQWENENSVSVADEKKVVGAVELKKGQLTVDILTGSDNDRLNFRIPRNFGPPHLHVSGGFEDRGITQ